MAFKENLKEKIRIDRLTERIHSTMRETPGKRNLNKNAVREMLEKTDYEHVKIRDLHLYVRPLNGGGDGKQIKEVLVLDNELPIYHSTVADVAMRKTPHWKEMFSIGNIKKVLNDRDVVVSKGKESLNHIRDTALARLDLSYDERDIAELVVDGHRGLEAKSASSVRDTLDLFFELLEYEPVVIGMLEEDFLVFARPASPRREPWHAAAGAAGEAAEGAELVKLAQLESRAERRGRGAQQMDVALEEGVALADDVALEEEADVYRDLILFDESSVTIRLVKGDFSPDSDLDIVRLLQCARGERPADLEGKQVFDYLGTQAVATRR